MIPEHPQDRARRRWRIVLVVLVLAVPVWDGVRANLHHPAGSEPATCTDC